MNELDVHSRSTALSDMVTLRLFDSIKTYLIR
jgi:hypothetical protein